MVKLQVLMKWKNMKKLKQKQKQKNQKQVLWLEVCEKNRKD